MRVALGAPHSEATKEIQIVNNTVGQIHNPIIKDELNCRLHTEHS